MQIFVYFSSNCFGSYAHLQEQIEFLLQMRHMVPLLQLGVLRSVRAGGEMHSCAIFSDAVCVCVCVCIAGMF